MTAVEKARAAYIDAAKASEKAFHSLKVRSAEAKDFRRVYMESRTSTNRRAYLSAKKIRNARYRAAKRAQAKKYRLRAKYTALKVLAREPLRVRALREAQSMLGVLEVGGNNRGPIVDKIIRSNGGDLGEAWCGDAVAYWYRRAGSTVVTRAWAAAHAGIWGWFTGVIRLRKLKNLKPGHIVEYDWQHTGLFEEWIDKSAGKFFAIEGNTGAQGNTSDTTADGIRRRVRNINDVAGAFSPQR